MEIAEYLNGVGVHRQCCVIYSVYCIHFLNIAIIILRNKSFTLEIL